MPWRASSVVVVEFESMEQARQWYMSPAYTREQHTAVYADGKMLASLCDARRRELLWQRIAADKVDEGYPRNTLDHWTGWPADFYPTAAVNWGNGKVYFFSDTQYLSFDIETDQVDYVGNLGENWTGWPIHTY